MSDKKDTDDIRWKHFLRLILLNKVRDEFI